jgi:hypothetical protein
MTRSAAALLAATRDAHEALIDLPHIRLRRLDEMPAYAVARENVFRLKEAFPFSVTPGPDPGVHGLPGQARQ